MRILDRYVGREVLSHSLLGLAVFTFVFFVPQLVRLMELVVRHSPAGESMVALLFACSLPSVLTFTIPMAALVGVLIGLGRLSADGEIVALNASGMGLRRLLLPIGVLSALAAGLTLYITFSLGPASLRTFHALEEKLRASQASFAVQPRVFDERFPHLVLYVQDVDAAAARWRGVILAESDAGAGSHLTLAENAIVVADRGQGKFELHFGAGSTHEYDPRDPQHYGYTAFGASDVPVEVGAGNNQRSVTLSDPELGWRDLLHRSEGAQWRDARIEFHRRLAFPAACILFAFLGVPVGVRPRRGGRSAGVVLTLLLISVYYLVFVAGIHYAQQGSLPPGVGVWAANLLAGAAAIFLVRRIEHVRGESHVWHWLGERVAAIGKHAPGEPVGASAETKADRPAANGALAGAALPDGATNGEPLASGPISSSVSRTDLLEGSDTAGRALNFPLLIDMHLLGTFFSNFLVMLAGFLVLFDAFTLFDLLPDISRHHISFVTVVNYFRYLVPLMVYQLVPLAALVATLVTLAVLAKSNELTALKASGVSLYRVALPLLLAGLALTGGMFLLDDTYLPYANQRQDAYRNEIKGKPAQTFYQPTHQWIFGEGNKIYNYDLFDSDQGLFGGLNVYELDPQTFQMRRRVYATRAHWEPAVNAWTLENGWVRDFSGGTVSRYLPFRVTWLGELTEPPSYFKREVLPSYQMNWRALSRYIASLRQAGFDTARLSVQWHKKFAYPLIAAIIVFLSVPFAFLVGTRGAIGGLALAVGIGIIYWAAAALFEAMGAVGQLPPLLAGWAPDVIFVFLGAYFFLKMPT